MRKVLIAIVALAAGAAGSLTVHTAGAGPPPPEDVRIELLSNVEPLRFGLTISESVVVCTEGTFAVTSVEVREWPSDDLLATVTPISITEDPTDPNAATMVLPSDTMAGVLRVTAICDYKDESNEAIGETLWAGLGITKVVDGSAPADAAFTVRVDCSDPEEPPDGLATRGAGWADVAAQEVGDTFVVDLPFTAAGGTKYVYMDSGGLCLVTEPVTGGATTVTVSNDIDTRPAPGSFTSTVTNAFAAELAPSFTG